MSSWLIGLIQIVGAIAAIRAATIAPGAAPTARSIVYHDRDVVTLHAKVHYTTLVILPEGDEVVEITCGDKDAWAINARGSLVSIKPAKAGTETNVNVLTTHGRVYAFLLAEVSKVTHGAGDGVTGGGSSGLEAGALEPDLAVYVDRESDLREGERPQYVPARQVEDFRLQAEVAREDARRAVDAAQTQLEEHETKFRRSYSLTLVFPYRFKAEAPPFFVRAMFHDGRFTYIQAHAPELPALYELKDGAPNLVNFEVIDGTYIVPKVLDRGYLAIGKRRFPFERRAR